MKDNLKNNRLLEIDSGSRILGSSEFGLISFVENGLIAGLR